MLLLKDLEYAIISHADFVRLEVRGVRGLCVRDSRTRVSGLPPDRGHPLGVPMPWMIIFRGLYWGALCRETTMCSFHKGPRSFLAGSSGLLKLMDAVLDSSQWDCEGEHIYEFSTRKG